MYPELCEVYKVLNVSHKLNVRRGGAAETKDNGIILAKRSLLAHYDFRAISHASPTKEGQPGWYSLLEANAGKPIVGVQILHKAQPIANVFGAHFEKGKTQQNLDMVCQMLDEDESTGKVPTVVTGDFNAVLGA